MAATARVAALAAAHPLGLQAGGALQRGHLIACAGGLVALLAAATAATATATAAGARGLTVGLVLGLGRAVGVIVRTGVLGSRGLVALLATLGLAALLVTALLVTALAGAGVVGAAASRAAALAATATAATTALARLAGALAIAALAIAGVAVRLVVGVSVVGVSVVGVTVLGVVALGVSTLGVVVRGLVGVHRGLLLGGLRGHLAGGRVSGSVGGGPGLRGLLRLLGQVSLLGLAVGLLRGLLLAAATLTLALGALATLARAVGLLTGRLLRRRLLLALLLLALRGVGCLALRRLGGVRIRGGCGVGLRLDLLALALGGRLEEQRGGGQAGIVGLAVVHGSLLRGAGLLGCGRRLGGLHLGRLRAAAGAAARSAGGGRLLGRLGGLPGGRPRALLGRLLGSRRLLLGDLRRRPLRSSLRGRLGGRLRLAQTESGQDVDLLLRVALRRCLGAGGEGGVHRDLVGRTLGRRGGGDHTGGGAATPSAAWGAPGARGFLGAAGFLRCALVSHRGSIRQLTRHTKPRAPAGRSSILEFPGPKVLVCPNWGRRLLADHPRTNAEAVRCGRGAGDPAGPARRCDPRQPPSSIAQAVSPARLPRRPRRSGRPAPRERNRAPRPPAPPARQHPAPARPAR